jgi:predicted dehydrogenase
MSVKTGAVEVPDRRLRVGIVGLHAGRSWAFLAHLPALRALANLFEIVGVANTTRASSEAAASAAGLPRAFGSVAELVSSPDVDIVTVTVKVPHHFELVKAALEAGKHVYCEWPLGNGLAQAEELAALARKKGVLGVAGTQARAAPEIGYLRKLIADGFVGDVLSTTMTAWAREWGASIDNADVYGYTLDKANGATMLTIPIGHTLAALRDVLGDIGELSAVVANRRPEVRSLDTGQTVPKTAADQVLVSALLASGAPLSLHYRGGAPRSGVGFTWEINGTEGDIRVTGPSGHTQLVPLTLEGGRGDEQEFRALAAPDAYREGVPVQDVVPGNVGRVYVRMAADLRRGTRTAPSFDDAVDLHRLLETIEAAAVTGARASVMTSSNGSPTRGQRE